MYNFGVGDLVKVFYFNVLHRYRKIFMFTGICTDYSILHRSFTLQNFYGSEFVRIHFMLGAPYIVAISVLLKNPLWKRQMKMYYQKRTRFAGGAAHLTSLQNAGPYQDPANYIYRIPLSKIERKRLRRKFRI